MREFITGRNPVYEVMRAKRRQVFKVLIANGVDLKGRITQIIDLANEIQCKIEWVDRKRIEHNTGANSQGIAVEVSGYPYLNMQDILEKAHSLDEMLFVLILDVIQDPQNLGTLLRTAEAVGVHGVVLPQRRAAGITPSVVSASSGGTEHLVITQANLSQAINYFKDNNVWVYGLERSDNAIHISQVNMKGPLALVVGGEGSGLRDLTRQSCDQLVYLPMVGKIESLNASIAGSVALYHAYYSRL